MSLRQYLITMILGTIICWIAWGIVIINIDPFTATTGSFALFYSTTYFALVGTISLLATPLRAFFTQRNEATYKYVEKGFKDGAIISFVLVVMLFLQAQQWLSPVTAITLILATVFISFFKYTTSRQQTRGGAQLEQQNEPDENQIT